MSNTMAGGGVPESPQLESFLSSYLNLPLFGTTGDYFTNPNLEGVHKNISNPAAPQAEEYYAAGISLLSKPACYGTEQLLDERAKGQKITHHEQEMMGGKKRKRGKEGGMSDGGMTDNHQFSDHHHHQQVGSEKPKEVIHVRAKRGQATDSHSLAERVRRERINEKLRVLQDLVPGCYKTMGMAVMLDVIINYVQSLQNQIEFLSMKLSAASMFYDFNSPEAEAVEALQLRTNNCEAREMERIHQQAREQQQQQHSHHNQGHGHGGGGGGGLFSTTTTSTDGDHLQSMWRF